MGHIIHQNFPHHPAHESARKTVRKQSPDFLKIVEVQKSIENFQVLTHIWQLYCKRLKYSRSILDVYRHTHLYNQI